MHEEVFREHSDNRVFYRIELPIRIIKENFMKKCEKAIEIYYRWYDNSHACK